MLCKNRNQVIPGRIAVFELSQILPDSRLESVLPHHCGELPHHHRGLVVNDIVIDQAGIVHIIKALPDCSAARSAVLGHCGSLVGTHEIQFVIDLREERFGDGGGEIICENLLGPYIIEPFHRHDIPEPHMGGLVGNQFNAAENLVRSRVGGQEEAGIIVESGPGMFHPTELEARQHHEIIFRKRIRHTCIFLQPVQSKSHLSCNLRNLHSLSRIFSTMECSGPVLRKVLIFKLSDSKCKEIGRKRVAQCECPSAKTGIQSCGTG